MENLLTNPVCGLLAACGPALHSSGDFPFESDHNNEVWRFVEWNLFFLRCEHNVMSSRILELHIQGCSVTTFTKVLEVRVKDSSVTGLTVFCYF